MRYLLHQSIGYHAGRTPEKAAFRSGGKAISYRMLDEQTNSIACTLHSLKVKKGDRVGIMLHRGLETAIAIYGILKAGAVYVPIDPKLPVERCDFLIADCGINVLISSSALEKKVASLHTEQLSAVVGIEKGLDRTCVSWQEATTKDIAYQSDLQLMDQDLAYILYTSGSTGVPKGIMHTHYSGMNYARLTAAEYDITGEDVLGNHAPINFDISTLGMFTGPYVGGTTVIATDMEVLFPLSLAQLLIKERISVWYSVPLAIIQMLESGGLKDSRLPDLRWLLYAGEPYPTLKLIEWMEQFPNIAVSNIYGPTETNQCTNYNLPALPDPSMPVPIGTTWGNTEYLVLDESNNPVEQGSKGELLIRSATNMLGYWNNQPLTDKSHYVTEEIPGLQKRYYRTGDLVILDKAGTMHFHGRKDRQVKIRGYRVELSEIENKLQLIDGVAECCSFATEIKDVQTLSAAIILKSGSTLDKSSITALLKQVLPPYAVPEDIYFVESFPRTQTGKINRNEIINDRKSST